MPFIRNQFCFCKNRKSVTNLINCVHFYGVLPTLKIDVKPKRQRPYPFRPNMRSHFAATVYVWIFGMSSSLSFSPRMNHERDLKHKMWCWWCDALYRTYLRTIPRFGACFTLDFFSQSLYFSFPSLCRCRSIHFTYILLSSWLCFFPFHSFVSSQSLQSIAMLILQRSIHKIHCHLALDEEITSMENLFITPDVFWWRHFSLTLCLWCIVKYFEEIYLEDEIEFKL